MVKMSWAKITLALASMLAMATAAHAQSGGGFLPGQTLTAAQVGAALAKKQDYVAGQTPAYLSVQNQFTQEQLFTSSNSGGASFRCTPGIAPASPVNGDIWCTSAGMYIQIGGSAQLLASPSGSGVSSFNGRSGVVNLTSGDVTGALAYAPLSAAANLSDISNIPAAAANIGLAQVKPLTAFGEVGSSDDAATITAANNAIIAAASTGGLVVEMPANTTINSSVGLILSNNGGWDCPILLTCVWKAVRSNANSAVSYAVSLSSQYDTGWLLRGIYFNGTWDQDWLGTGAKAAWIGKQNAAVLINAYNGDAANNAFEANSKGSLQEPAGTVADVYFTNFGGDCFDWQGAGGGTAYDVRAENCGAYGSYLNVYDSHFVNIDIGATGLSGMVCGNVGCADDEFNGLYLWYAGAAQNVAHDHDLEVYGNSNNFMGMRLQDSTGDLLYEDNDFNNTFNGTGEWQGCQAWMAPNVAGIRTGGGAQNKHNMNISMFGVGYACQASFPNVTLVVNDTLSTSNPYNPVYSVLNTFNLLVQGFPGAYPGDNRNYYYNPSWIEGPVDTTNTFNINGTTRTPRNYVADPATGQYNFGLPMNGAAVGLVVNGPNGPYPGGVGLISQNSGGTLQGYTTTAAAASGTITASSNFSDGQVVVIGSQAWTMKNTLIASPPTFSAAAAGGTLTVQETSFHLNVGDLVYGLVQSPGTPIPASTYISAQGSCGGSTCTYTLANYSATAPQQVMTAQYNQVHIGSTLAASLTNLSNAINGARPTVFQHASQSGTTLTVTGGATNGVILPGDTLNATDLTSVPNPTLTQETIVSGTYVPLGTSTFTTSVSQTFNPIAAGSWVAQHGVQGTDFSWSNTGSLSVVTTADATHLYVTAQVAGVAGNSLALNTTSSATPSGSTLSGGTAGTQTYNTALYWSPSGIAVLKGSPTLSSGYNTISGTCATSGYTGLPLAGTLTIGASCTASTIVMTFGAGGQQTAPNGYACFMTDMTTPADTFRETAYTTTSVTFTGTGANGDHVIYGCPGAF